MSSDRFFVGLLASLRLLNVVGVDTDNDLHQKAFAAVVNAVTAASKNGFAGVLAPSVVFYPSAFTGRYGQWELALLQLCAQWTGTRVAVGSSVPIGLSTKDAERLLATFLPKQRAFVQNMARVYQAASAGSN